MHQRDLHLLFVISLHSSAQALREILPRSKMEHLRIEPFKLEPSVQLLKRIVSEVRQGTGLGAACAYPWSHAAATSGAGIGLAARAVQRRGAP